DPPVESVKEQKARIRGYIDLYTRKTTLIQKEIEQLGSALGGVTATEGTDSAGSNSLSGLLALKQQKELELVEARLLLMTAQDAVSLLDRYISTRETKDLLFKAEPLWSLSTMGEEAPPKNQSAATGRPREVHSTLLFLASVTLLFCFLSILPKFLEFVSQPRRSTNMLSTMMISIARSTRISKVVLGSAAGLALSVSLAPPVFSDLLLFTAAVLIVFYYLLLRLLLRCVLLRYQTTGGDSEPGVRQAGKDEWMLYGFSLISAVVIVFSSVYAPSGQVSFSVLLSSSLFLLWLAALFMFCRYCCLCLKPSLCSFLRLPLAIALIILAGLEILGYRNLIDHITFALVYSFVVFSFALLFYDSIEFLMQLFRSGKERLAQRFSMTPLESKRKFETHKILGIFLKIYIVLGALVLVLHQWGVSARDNDRLWNFFFQGFSMGGFAISPARVTLALLLFVVGWPAIEYFKQFLNRGWLTSAGLSKNDRETFLTISGYLGYAAITLIILAVAGVKLTGLTVIIGALSVGIGFGLQNVVNNFISGLILMFEKPIKKGDWILVGTTEGYVKKISIRSTIVQTFDRADVIVPNSELISSQVINMMFDDQRGRLRVSVGVAYGSDTNLVMQLLLDAANGHDQVITDGSTPEPRVIFQAFGDSSLNFDLLVHLKDIDMKMRVRNDLHLIIDKAFKENGVEIPFPQRDIHIKDGLEKVTGDQP
ncbi:MAG: mechanosensitive ion channel, partial [Desulfofustis sp.]|nr:mechanosensitive ion channel [Desulfofustis sp.]